MSRNVPRFALFAKAFEDFLVRKLSATSLDYYIKTIRLNRTDTSSVTNSVYETTSFNCRGNTFNYAIHVQKNTINNVPYQELNEAIVSYFEKYSDKDRYYVRQIPVTAEEYSYQDDTTYCIILKVKYLNYNNRYNMEGIRYGDVLPFPLVDRSCTLELLEKNKKRSTFEMETISIVGLDVDERENVLRAEIERLHRQIDSLDITQHNMENIIETSTARVEELEHEVGQFEEEIFIAKQVILSINKVNVVNVNPRQKLFRELYKESNRKDMCSICYDEIKSDNMHVSDCSHIFCLTCAKKSYKFNRACPICRQHTLPQNSLELL